MAFLSSMDISGSGLTAQKLRMNVISQNIANAGTTRTETGGPYVKKTTVLESKEAEFEKSLASAMSDSAGASGSAVTGGVVVKEIAASSDAFKPVYDPKNPDANAEGYVMMPNVDTTQEMIDMMSASRSYEANLTAFNAVKLMATKALEIGK